MVDHAEDLMVVTLVRGVERDLGEYLGSESVSDQEKAAVLELSKRETVQGRARVVLEAKDVALRRQFGVIRE
jgi:hypothetical protein